MNKVVILSGSPAPGSRTEKVLQFMGDKLQEHGVSVKIISVREVSPETLFHADFQAREIHRIADFLTGADGCIVASPVYNVSLTGVLKALLDVLPRDIFSGMPVLPMMTGGTEKHFMALDYALKPVLAFMKGDILRGIYVLDKQISRTGNPPIKDEETLRRMDGQLAELLGRMKLKESTLCGDAEVKG